MLNDAMFESLAARRELQDRKCDAAATTKSTPSEAFESWTLRNPLISSMAWVAILFAIALSVHTPAYETNDDVLMSMIASGTGAAASPDEHLVFTNISIGLVLKQLYTHFPSVPWYATYLMGLQYLAHVAVLYAVLTWRYGRGVLFCYFALFVTVGVQLIARLQFTSTAVWTTECGLFLALNGLARRQKGDQAFGMLAAGTVLMVLGSLVRLDAYIAALAIGTVPLAALVWQLDRCVEPAARIWRTALKVIVLTQCLAFGMHAIHHFYYAKDPAWREFLVFNPYRVKFNDYCWTSYTEESKPVFDSVQWTENDHQMIQNYFFDDPQVYSRAKLQAIVEGFPWGRNAVSLHKMKNWWAEILRNPRIWPIWMLIPLQIGWARNRRFALGHFLMVVVSLNLFLCGLMLLKNPPARVYYPLIAFQTLYLLMLMRCGETVSTEKRGEKSLSGGANPEPRFARFRAFMSHGLDGLTPLALALLGLIIGQYNAAYDSRTALCGNCRLQAELVRINPRDDDLFVCWGDRFPYESILPFESPNNYRNLHLYSLGWIQQSPVNDAVKRRFGIENTTLALFNNPHVFLLGASDADTAGTGRAFDHYQTFIREHYQMDLKWKDSFDVKQFKICKPVLMVAEASNPNSVTR